MAAGGKLLGWTVLLISVPLALFFIFVYVRWPDRTDGSEAW